ncbi:MAG: hypothetical protein AABW85_00280 [archaeon]
MPNRRTRKPSKIEKATKRRQDRLLRAERIRRHFAKLQEFYNEKIVNPKINEIPYWKELIDGVTEKYGSESHIAAFFAAERLQERSGIEKKVLWEIARAIRRDRIK